MKNIVDAAYAGTVEDVRKYLESNVSAKPSLELSAKYIKSSLVHFRNGDKSGIHMTALHAATLRKISDKNKHEIIRLLLDNGAEPLDPVYDLNSCAFSNGVKTSNKLKYRCSAWELADDIGDHAAGLMLATRCINPNSQYFDELALKYIEKHALELEGDSIGAVCDSFVAASSAENNIAASLLSTASVYGCVNIAKCLLQKGVDPNTKEAFRYALKTDDASLVKAFIEAGADVNKVFADGRSALQIAMQQPSCVLAIIELLINAGADIHQKNANGQTSLDYCQNPLFRTKVLQLFEARQQRTKNILPLPSTRPETTKEIPLAHVVAEPHIASVQNKGGILSFMFCCCTSKQDEVREPAATATKQPHALALS